MTFTAVFSYKYLHDKIRSRSIAMAFRDHSHTIWIIEASYQVMWFSLASRSTFFFKSRNSFLSFKSEAPHRRLYPSSDVKPKLSHPLTTKQSSPTTKCNAIKGLSGCFTSCFCKLTSSITNDSCLVILKRCWLECKCFATQLFWWKMISRQF